MGTLAMQFIRFEPEGIQICACLCGILVPCKRNSQNKTYPISKYSEKEFFESPTGVKHVTFQIPVGCSNH